MSSKIKVDTIENVAGSGNVSLGAGHNLVVPGTLAVTGDATFDTSTLKVDSSNNKVGIGTTSPTGKLTVDGGFLEVDVSGTQSIRVGSTDHIVGGTDNDAVLQSNTGKNMRFLTGGTERIRLHSGGVVSFNNGIELGSGLDATAANTLDDYEEGTWTPSVTVGSVGTVNGNYRKVGGLVNLRGYMANFANTTNNESMFITGLPFTVATDTASGVAMWEYINTNFAFSVVYSAASTSRLQFFYSTDGAWDDMRHIDLDSSSSRVHFSITYHTDQ